MTLFQFMRLFFLLPLLLCGASTMENLSFKQTPGSGISHALFAADRFADGMASINTATCANSTIFGANPTPIDRATLDYIRIAGFRHVRDGFAPFCYNQKAYDRWWSSVAMNGRITLTAGLGVGYTEPLLASLKQTSPRLDGLEFSNEWDSAAQPANGSVKLAIDVKIGSRVLPLGRNMAFFWIVPGQSYRIDDGAQSETVIVPEVAPDSLDNAALEKPLQFDHAAGTPVRRDGDFVSDMPFWYRLYTPLVHRLLPGVTVLGPSLAHPINGSAFSHANVSLGHEIDALDSHPYPLDAENPEGADGDGFRGATHVDHPPCSYGATSYSFEFNVICSGRQIAGSDSSLPTWITEYSYQVVPDGASQNSRWPHAIPDDVAVDYLAASEFFAASRGVSRLFWFQIRDGTSGPQSAFCTFGLLRDAICDPSYATTPEPKPEFLALMAMANYFDDRACRGTCLQSRRFDGRWEPSALPLNTSNAHFSDGRTAVVFWLGSSSYDSHSAETCGATTSCYTSIPPKRERFESPALRAAKAVYVTGIDDDSKDPLPQISTIRPADGLGAVTARRCTGLPESQPRFGCILPLRKIRVTGESVTIDAKRELQWLVIVPKSGR